MALLCTSYKKIKVSINIVDTKNECNILVCYPKTSYYSIEQVWHTLAFSNLFQKIQRNIIAKGNHECNTSKYVSHPTDMFSLLTS